LYSVETVRLTADTIGLPVPQSRLPVQVWLCVCWLFGHLEVISLVRFSQSGVERMLQRITRMPAMF